MSETSVFKPALVLALMFRITTVVPGFAFSTVAFAVDDNLFPLQAKTPKGGITTSKLFTVRGN